jgi:hypothetical protein
MAGYQGWMPGFQAGAPAFPGAVFPGGQGFVANFSGFNPRFQPFSNIPLQPPGFNAGSGFEGAGRGGAGRRKRNDGRGTGRGDVVGGSFSALLKLRLTAPTSTVQCRSNGQERPKFEHKIQTFQKNLKKLQYVDFIQRFNLRKFQSIWTYGL